MVSVFQLYGCALTSSKMTSIEITDECSISIKNLSAEEMDKIIANHDIDHPCKFKSDSVSELD